MILDKYYSLSDLPGSPKRSSPLANPPILSPSRGSSSRPTPIPRSERTHRRTSLHLSSIPPVTPTSTGDAPQSGSQTAINTSPPLSRSHPLLGSFSLSLSHSRMSHAHAPHSVAPSSTSGFSLHLGALGKGRSCPPELRCPPHEIFPFSATYYDLEDGGRKSSTPWVGNIDLENHYYIKYTSDQGSHVHYHGNELPPAPPNFPGYRVAPIGQLQILIKTPDSAVKVFLVPYDLRSLAVGARMLTRERTYVVTDSSTSDINLSSPSPSSIRSDMGVREKLRYSVQLQFTCIPRPHPIAPSRSSSTTRRLRSQGEAGDIQQILEEDAAKGGKKDYYLSKHIRVIFTSTSPESDETTRTERNDEIVPPSTDIWGIGKTGNTPISSPRMSFSSPRSAPRRDDWETVRLKWHARREVEAFERDTDLFDRPDIHQIRPATPPVSLLSSQVLSPPGVSTSLPPDSIPAIRSPLPTLPGMKSLVIDTSGRVSPSQPPSIKTPPPHRYPTRQKLRRGSGSLDERELSEKLRHLKVNQH